MSEAPVLEGSPAPPPPMSRRRRWLGHAGVLVALGLLLALGTWQVERLHWKQGIIDRIEARVSAPPVPVAEIERLASRTGDVDYVPATARGTFLHADERFFVTTFGGRAGWNVTVPMLLENGRDVLFVNRGFVPYEMRDAATRPAGQVEGTVTVEGLARNERRAEAGWFLPDNDAPANVFLWADIADLSDGLDLPAGARVLPFLLDAGPGAAPGGWPVGGTTVIDVPNNHLQYAVTWYGLALALAAMYAGFAFRRRRPDGAAPAPAP